MRYLHDDKIKYIRQDILVTPFLVNRYHTYEEVQDLSNISTIEANKLYFNSLRLGQNRYKGLSISCQGNVEESSININIGIYNSRDGRLPNLLLETANFSIDNISRDGIKENQTFELELINETYFLAYIADASNSMLSSNAGNSSGLIYKYGVLKEEDNSNFLNVQSGLKYDYSYAAFPTQFVSNNFTREDCTTSPLIFINS